MEKQDCNVLIVTLDALRADHLGFWGYKRKTSPNIDRLAGQATVFKNNVSQASFSSPGNIALLTSTYSLGTNLDVLNPKLETIASVLQSNDYFTGAIINSTVTSKKRGFGKGFDEFFESGFSREGVEGLGKDVDAETVVKKAVGWIEGNRERKWFLLMQLVDTHGPYTAPKPFSEMFVGDAYYDESSEARLLQHYVGFGGIPDYQQINGINKVGWYVAQYDGAIAYMDSCIGKLLKELGRLGLREKTVVVLVSDHGESMSEHGIYFSHSASLYEETIHVPMILSLPGKGHAQVEQISRSIDLMPTVLDFLGIAVPKQARGRSLLALADGRSLEELAAFSAINAEIGTLAAKQYISSVRKGKWKLIRERSSIVNKGQKAKKVLQGMRKEGIAKKLFAVMRKSLVLAPILIKGALKKPTLELYNLENDSKELNNLAGREKAKAKELGKLLDSWEKENAEREEEQLKLGEETELDQETEKELRRLGYVK